MLQVSLRTLFRWSEELERRVANATLFGSVVGDLGGAAARWDEELDEFLEALLSHRPEYLGYSRTSWTVPLLRAHLGRASGEWFHENTVRARLLALGYRWKRPRYVLTPDPRREQRIQEIRAKLKDLGPRHVALCMDETDLLLFPPLRSGWAQVGEAARVEISGWNEKRVIFGALAIASGHLLLLVRERHQAPDFQAFLRLIRHQYRGWHPVLVLDQHPSHTAGSTQALARALGIEHLWLPARSPELNPMDTLWGKAKDQLASNRQYDDIDDQADSFMELLQDRPDQELLRLSGLLSGSHWLRNL
jgi:hypothetical protein